LPKLSTQKYKTTLYGFNDELNGPKLIPRLAREFVAIFFPRMATSEGGNSKQFLDGYFDVVNGELILYCDLMFFWR
jgi:hypothetical protein